MIVQIASLSNTPVELSSVGRTLQPFQTLRLDGLLAPTQEMLDLDAQHVVQVELVEQDVAVDTVQSFFSAIGGGSGLVADGVVAPWAIAVSAPLTHSLQSRFGPPPNFARSATGTAYQFVKDHLGYMHQTLAGEAIFWGSRRVRNLARGTEALDDSNFWTLLNTATVAKVWDVDLPPAFPEDDVGGYAYDVTSSTSAASVIRQNSTYALTLPAISHIFSVWAKAPLGETYEVRLYINGGASLKSLVITGTGAWQKIAVRGTPDGTSSYVWGVAPSTFAGTAVKTVRIARPQLEALRNGQTAPSEYVSRDDSPRGRYWSGANVDGVRYLSTTMADTHDNTTTGVVTQTAGTALTTMLGMACMPTTRNFASTDITTHWTGTRATPTLSGGTKGPDGETFAHVLTEDATASNSHFVSYTLVGTNAYDGKGICVSVYLKAGSRGHAAIAVTDVDGAQKTVRVNLSTGALSNLTAGCYAQSEQMANGWWRVMLRCVLGTGGSDCIMRIFLADSSGATSYSGDGTSNIFAWVPNATSALSSGGSDRAMYALPALNASTSVSDQPGSHCSWDLDLWGLTDLAVAAKWTLYGDMAEAQKSGTTAVYGAMSYARSGYGDVRCGLSVRPGQTVGNAHQLKIAMDVYAGDRFESAKWTANTDYALGQIRIPTDTTLDNANSRKMFTVVQAGTSDASEPTWDTTFVATPDTITNITTDGTVKWQCNHDNGINGQWENYLGAHLTAPATGWLETLRYGWFVLGDDYGLAVNGEWATKQTLPQFEQGFAASTLPHKLRTLTLGSLGQITGAPGQAQASGYSADAAMSVWTTFHRDVAIYHTSPTADAVMQAAA
jgi:hypothetical protein